MLGMTRAAPPLYPNPGLSIPPHIPSPPPQDKPPGSTQTIDVPHQTVTLKLQLQTSPLHSAWHHTIVIEYRNGLLSSYAKEAQR